MNILFTSVGNLSFPCILSDTGLAELNLNIYGTDVRKNAHGLYFCDEGFIVPYRDSDEFEPAILRIIEEKKIQILWPLSTEDQTYFSRNKNVYSKAGVELICSNYNAVEVSNDKLKLYQKLQENHIPVPDFIYPVSSVESAVASLHHSGIVLKSRTGTGGKHTFLILNSGSKSDQQSIDDQFIFDHNKVNGLIQEGVADLIATEYLPGKEYSVDCLSYNGEFIYGVVRHRTSTQGGLAMECEIVEVPELIDNCKKIIALVGLSFINNLQFRVDQHGIHKLIDINPRIPGTIQLTLESGLPMVSDAIKLLLNQPLAKASAPKKLKLIRYFHGIVFDPQKSNIHD